MSSEQFNVNLERIDTQMGELLSAFEAHPEMQPPSPNPTIFFTFDFLRNTHRQLRDIDADKFLAGDRAARGAAQEVLGRIQFANTLVNDRSGKLALLTGGDPNQGVDFGDEIRRLAGGLVEH